MPNHEEQDQVNESMNYYLNNKNNSALRNKTLEERQEEREKEYNSNESLNKYGRPKRLSEENDSKLEKATQLTSFFAGIVSKVKEREAKILQHLVALRDLGLDCYYADGTPIITTCRKGHIGGRGA